MAPRNQNTARKQQKTGDHARLQLMIVRNGETIAKGKFSGPKVTIGRAPDVDLRVDDPFISGRHCNLEIRSNRVYLRDRGSTNGTLLNGRRETHVPLQDGDALKVGRTFVVVKFLNGLASGNNHSAKTHVDLPSHSDKTHAELTAGSLTVNDEVSKEESSMRPTTRGFSTAPAPQTRRIYDDEFTEDFEPTKTFDPNDFDEVALDDFERNFESGFKLVKLLTADEKRSVGSRKTTKTLEILEAKSDDILAANNYDSGTVVIGGDKTARKLFKVKRDGAIAMLRADDQGLLFLDGRKISIVQAIQKGQAKSARGGLYYIQLGHEDKMVLDIEGKKYIAKFVEKTELPGNRLSFDLSREMRAAIAISFLTHVLAIGIVALISFRANQEVKKDANRFAKVDISKLDFKKPEPPKAKPTPKPEPPKVAKAEPKPKPKLKPKPKPKPKQKIAKKITKPVPKPKKITKPTRVASKKPVKRQGAPSKKPMKKAGAPRNTSKMGALGALGGMNNKFKNSQVASAITNLKAVKAQGGAQTFSVSGLQGKVDNGDISIQRVGDLNTKGASNLGNRNFGVAAISGQKGSGFGVGALVQGDDAVINPRGAGGLSPAQVRKIIEENVWQIMSCYEKGLMDAPDLQGKLLMDWAISPSGSVTSVRVRKSELRSGGVHSCVTTNIRSWQFPKAKNGMATDVSFPFVFSPSMF